VIIIQVIARSARNHETIRAVVGQSVGCAVYHVINVQREKVEYSLKFTCYRFRFILQSYIEKIISRNMIIVTPEQRAVVIMAVSYGGINAMIAQRV
jgi:hypothetical protein